MTKKTWLCATVALALLAPGAWAQDGEGDPYVLATISEVNGTLRAEWMDLRAEWMDLRVEQIEMLTIGQGRSTTRLHRQPFRWVAGDWRREADGNKLTWLVDLSDGLGSTGLSAAGVEAALDRAVATWSSDACLGRVPLVKRTAGSSDPDIFDAGFGYGGFGNYRTADIVHAGWLPPDFFDRVGGPGSGESVVALSVTFIYVTRDGLPTDFDNDGHLDTAHSEIYYNQGFSWLAGTANSMDVETVALHELGHALGIGHIGPPLSAIMNPIYAGARTELEPLDHAALCSVWGSWPK
ncbi:MAG TPA: matrixin family metalloprotease [Thermoanaerobaculia bacterium]|nr:matrixin family metalloprotease [Thermoanaerobaculia bacterium]